MSLRKTYAHRYSPPLLPLLPVRVESVEIGRELDKRGCRYLALDRGSCGKIQGQGAVLSATMMGRRQQRSELSILQSVY
jgi:hypothetical protein